jgi:regulatory protein
MTVPRETIAAITPSPRDPTMRTIRVGKKNVATLRATDIEHLQIEVVAQRARKAAFTMLGRRSFSRGELLDRLLQKGNDRAIAQKIVDELAADQWIDDAKYAAEVAAHEKRKGIGSTDFLHAALSERQISDDLAHQTAEQSLSQTDAIETAMALIKRRLGVMTNLPPNKVRNRVASLLTRRGFDEDTVNTVLERLGVGDDSTPL